MRVYFDARMVDHPGIGRYIRCLLPLIAKDLGHRLYILGNKEKIKKFLGIEENVVDFDHPIYSLQEQIGFFRLKRDIKRGEKGKGGREEKGHILHVPHYNIPVLAKFNLVATVHDLIHIAYPEGASGKLAPACMRFMIKRIMNTASGVICVSRSTKDEIEKRFSKCLVNRFPSTIERPFVKTVQDAAGQPAFLNVIYEGIDGVFTKISDPAYLKSVKEKYKLPDKFLLYVGSIRRHKNIRALLDAFDAFRLKNPQVSLVMVGRRSQDIDVGGKGVVYLGELESDKELAAIYNLASCLFNLSLYEGFGLTILEAQKCGLPIVCSDIPVHREIAGAGALFVNPTYIDPSTPLRVNGECNRTIDQIYENLYNVLLNDGTRRALISSGLENAKRFDWASTARQTLELYRKVYDEGCDSSRLASGHAGRRKDPQCFLQNIPPS